METAEVPDTTIAMFMRVMLETLAQSASGDAIGSVAFVYMNLSPEAGGLDVIRTTVDMPLEAELTEGMGKNLCRTISDMTREADRSEPFMMSVSFERINANDSSETQSIEWLDWIGTITHRQGHWWFIGAPDSRAPRLLHRHCARELTEPTEEIAH